MAAAVSVLAFASARSERAILCSSKNRKHCHLVLVRDLTPEHRVFDLKSEIAGRAYPAMRGKRSAEHQRIVRKRAIHAIATQKRLRMQHRRNRTLLVHNTLAVLD